MALDLGGIFGQIGQGVLDYQRQRFLPDVIAQNVPAYDSPFIPNFLETNLPVDMAVSTMACSRGGPKRTLGYLSADGTFCKKKSRRRRQRLATKSDIKDLASLKGIIGTGKAFDTWIATH